MTSEVIAPQRPLRHSRHPARPPAERGRPHVRDPEHTHRSALCWGSSSRADAADHFRDLAAHHVPVQAGTEIERILVDGEDAVVFGEIRLTARPTGRPYRARLALHLTVRDGLIVRHHVYEDSLAVARAFAIDSGAR